MPRMYGAIQRTEAYPLSRVYGVSPAPSASCSLNVRTRVGTADERFRDLLAVLRKTLEEREEKNSCAS